MAVRQRSILCRQRNSCEREALSFWSRSRQSTSANADSLSDHLMPGRWMPSAAASRSASGRTYREKVNELRQNKRLRLVRTNYIGRDYLDKLRGSGFRFQWITCYLAEQIGVDRPCMGNGSSDISFYCRPIAFKVLGSFHVDFFCDRLKARFILDGQADSILGMFKAFVASCNAKRSQNGLYICHWYILPNSKIQEDDRADNR